VARKR